MHQIILQLISLTLVTILAAKLSTAVPMDTLTARDGNGKDWSRAWASFCHDDKCSQDCGDWVPIDPPESAKTRPCLDQSKNNGSVKFRDVTMWDFSLVISPKVGCACQSENLYMADGSARYAISYTPCYEECGACD